MRKISLLAVAVLLAIAVNPVWSQPPPTPVIVTIGDVDEADPTVKPLLGVISGPIPPFRSPAPDLTARFQDIGVVSVRNNDYFDDRMDIEGIFNCGGPTYPSWEGCDPADEANYNWGPSDELFESWIAGGFEPFLRLGGEVQNAVRHHDFKGPQNPVQEANWIQAAIRVVDRYLHWGGRDRTFTYLDIWTEFPSDHFWDRSNYDFIRFWARAFQALKGAYPELRIGGPGFIAGQTVRLVAGERNVVRGFLQYLYENNIRPDWLGWHLFYNDPLTWYRAARAYRALLNGEGIYSDVPWAGTGFFDGVEMIVDAYGVSSMNMTPQQRDRIYDQALGAAVRTGSWIAMQYSDVERAYLYRAGDAYSSPGQNPDVGIMGEQQSGLFYGDPQASYKPAAHAFRLWARVVNEFPILLSVPVAEIGPESGLWVLAARNDQGQVAVLLSNITSDDITWVPDFTFTTATLDNYMIEIYQVDNELDGRTAQSWNGSPLIAPAESVQLVIMTPR